MLLLRQVSIFWDSECIMNYFARQVFKLTETAAFVIEKVRETAGDSRNIQINIHKMPGGR